MGESFGESWIPSLSKNRDIFNLKSPLKSNRLQIYTLRIYKNSLKRKEVDLQAIDKRK